MQDSLILEKRRVMANVDTGCVFRLIVQVVLKYIVKIGLKPYILSRVTSMWVVLQHQ